MDDYQKALFATDDPMALFAQWLEQAKATPAIAEPTAMSLATVNAAGEPSARIVLLKDHVPDGFVFFTNLDSRKSREIKQTGQGAACFYWMPLDRQVRLAGTIEPLEASASDAYFAGRPRERQIGAITSRQSDILPSREQFMTELEETAARFGDGPIPRPAYWGGWRLVPREIEFWIQLPHRYHERRQFLRDDADAPWRSTRLYP